jgi:hypothetical protein
MLAPALLSAPQIAIVLTTFSFGRPPRTHGALKMRQGFSEARF